MEVTSSSLGVYTLVFTDRNLDHAFGDLLCCVLRDDARVERASHYTDYDSQKLEVVMHESFAATARIELVVQDAVYVIFKQVGSLINQI